MKVNIEQYNGLSLAALRRIAADHNVRTLLSASHANPKIFKNSKLGAMTFPLHLAPAKISGRNVCPNATPDCIDLCLNTAGNPAYSDGKKRARLARTKLFFNDRKLFFGLLISEMFAASRKAKRAGMVPAFRLNATSDLRWEKFDIHFSNDQPITKNCTLFDLFDDCIFYDYTKIADRVTPANYHLTFSLSESNRRTAEREIDRGVNVAVVLHLTRNHTPPSSWRDRPMISGDLSDWRPGDGIAADGRGQYIALTAKGRAIGSPLKFVHSVEG